MMIDLVKYLKTKRKDIVDKVRINVVRGTVGYSDDTQWDTTISFDEIEVVDFEKLMQQIAEFEESFKKKK